MTRMTAEQRLDVLAADDYRCVAPKIDPGCGPCRNFYGEVIQTLGPMHPDRDLTVEHVVPGYGRLGRRADNDLSQMTTLCWFHHLGHGAKGQGGSIWALGHKADLRRYLASRSPSTGVL